MERTLLLAQGFNLIFQPPSYLDELIEEEESVSSHLMNSIPVPRAPIPCIQGFAEVIIPLMDEEEFRSHFRMLPTTFEFVLSLLEPTLKRNFPGNKVMPRKQLLVALWRMSTPDSYRSVRQRFGVGKATAIRCVRRVTRGLCSIASRFIEWPAGERVQLVANGFRTISTFPNVIGAIDGMHVNIPAPAENPEAYVNRKGHFSLQLQAVCDHSRMFTHVYVGHVGSVHDARVFRLSELNEYLEDPIKFPGDTHLIGDAAYTLHSNLLVPYTDNGHLTLRQKNFNFCLSSARMVIERSFALLRGRWRSLARTLEMLKTECVPDYVLACCVLHNICLLKQDELREYTAPVIDNDEHEERNAVRGENRVLGVAKRDMLCATLRIRDV